MSGLLSAVSCEPLAKMVSATEFHTG